MTQQDEDVAAAQQALERWVGARERWTLEMTPAGFREVRDSAGILRARNRDPRVVMEMLERPR